MLLHWIWLAHRPGLTDWAKGKLLEQFGNPEDLFCAPTEKIGEGLNLSPETRASLLDRDLSGAEKILQICKRKKIQILTMQDGEYPDRLRNIPDPPMVLYYKGILPDFDALPAVGVVGTRKASAYGMQTAKRMGYQIAKNGGLVVSGLAAGVDAMAMEGALLAGKPTVGVLGCGVDVVYPKSNGKLFADMEAYGCILSEFAPGTQPLRWNFPQRNRIIAGLSCGVLVVEAPDPSGALITARKALDQGRDVFVVPGNIDNPSCVGSNQLLRSGATAVTSGWEIMSEYQALFPGLICREEAALPQEAPVISLRENNTATSQGKGHDSGKKTNPEKETDKKVIDKGNPAPYSDVNDILPKLSSEERKIVCALMDGQRLADDVIAETGLTTGKALGIFTMLELKKVIVRLPGKRICLKIGNGELAEHGKA